ncbi:hypothetical protein H6P81_016088 [Aristolochia fimbriata]|uniref:Uncharacterized protein n=1 Tax=Aristolochia fimbriata TaxID=158543 RepID=A0AAV7E7S1_ARIFI|nr:hypothetical protein H6P81_016088 [Aristolochia fimbriata]
MPLSRHVSPLPVPTPRLLFPSSFSPPFPLPPVSASSRLHPSTSPFGLPSFDVPFPTFPSHVPAVDIPHSFPPRFLDAVLSYMLKNTPLIGISHFPSSDHFLLPPLTIRDDTVSSLLASAIQALTFLPSVKRLDPLLVPIPQRSLKNPRRFPVISDPSVPVASNVPNNPTLPAVWRPSSSPDSIHQRDGSPPPPIQLQNSHARCQLIKYIALLPSLLLSSLFPPIPLPSPHFPPLPFTFPRPSHSPPLLPHVFMLPSLSPLHIPPSLHLPSPPSPPLAIRRPLWNKSDAPSGCPSSRSSSPHIPPSPHVSPPHLPSAPHISLLPQAPSDLTSPADLIRSDVPWRSDVPYDPMSPAIRCPLRSNVPCSSPQISPPFRSPPRSPPSVPLPQISPSPPLPPPRVSPPPLTFPPSSVFDSNPWVPGFDVPAPPFPLPIISPLPFVCLPSVPPPGSPSIVLSPQDFPNRLRFLVPSLPLPSGSPLSGTPPSVPPPRNTSPSRLHHSHLHPLPSGSSRFPASPRFCSPPHVSPLLTFPLLRVPLPAFHRPSVLHSSVSALGFLPPVLPPRFSSSGSLSPLVSPAASCFSSLRAPHPVGPLSFLLIRFLRLHGSVQSSVSQLRCYKVSSRCALPFKYLPKSPRSAPSVSVLSPFFPPVLLLPSVSIASCFLLLKFLPSVFLLMVSSFRCPSFGFPSFRVPPPFGSPSFQVPSLRFPSSRFLSLSCPPPPGPQQFGVPSYPMSPAIRHPDSNPASPAIRRP